MKVEEELRAILTRFEETDRSHPQQVYDPTDLAVEEIRDLLRARIRYWVAPSSVDSEFHEWLVGSDA